MSKPARFSDGQYKNWLKCSHSLIIMTKALHDYIDNEVKKLHDYIKQKVSSIPCGSSTGIQCGSCSWKNIKLTGGNPRTWSINCKNGICDKWLQEILAVHDDRHNPSINWKNADISKWPTDCYQVAKIFMPRGQDKATMMPKDLDTVTILSLMKYCSWFRKDLPNIQILSHLMNIRNKVFHSRDMKVADSNKDSWIDLMIQLLTDLKISGGAQTELQKLKNSPMEEEQRITAVDEQMENDEKLSGKRGTSSLKSELKYPPPLPEGKDFHAYFLYETLSSDRDWVRDVIARLEKDGLKCGCHERDFMPGNNVFSNFFDALEKSLKVVAVISPDFIQNKWTMLSIEQSLARSSVIAVLLHDCKIPDCLKNITYLDAQVQEHVWWPRLKKAIIDIGQGEVMPRQQGLPPEILRMDERSQQLYKEALETGKVKVYNIRLMIVGHLGVGKTTLTKRILDEKVPEAPHVPTEGIEVHSRCCKIDLVTKKWIVEKKEDNFPDNSQCLVNIVSEYFANKGEKSKDNVNREEKNSIQHITMDSGSIPVPNELDQKKSKSGDKNTLCPEENVQENQTSTSMLRMINNTKSHSDLNEFVTKCRKMTPSDKTFCYVTMLDFAGEFFFYTTHQAFMSWRTLYLLVTDISKSLDDSIKGDECSMKKSIQDYVVYWFNSIYSHGIPIEISQQCEGRTQGETENDDQNCDGTAKYPPVILVATHSDKLSDKLSEGEKNKIKKEYFDGVRKILKDRPQRFLLKETIAISNFGPVNDIDALKQKMFELAEKQGYWGEEIPGRWLTLEQKLMELKRRGVKIIEYSDVEEINTSCDVKIENPDELKVFLRYEHDLGNIVFFNTAKLQGKVVLDPVWIIDGVRNLTSPKPHMTDNHPEIHPEWYEFKCTGQLTESLIGHLWSGDEREDFAKNGKHLLDLMEKLSIITKPVKTDDNVQDQKLCYWVPCVIDKPAPDHVKNGGLCKGITRTSTLGFVSKTEFIHVGVFHRLLASFLSIWQPVKENNDEYRLYSDCCEFDLEDCHSLLLILNDYAILATILRCEEEDPDNKLCCSIKERISSTLNDITACISPNVKFDMCVKCDKSSTYTLDGLHPCNGKRKKWCHCSKPDHSVKVENLMKFWERKDNCQQQQGSVKSDFLNAAKQRDDATLNHDYSGSIGMYRNLRVKDEIQMSAKVQAGNMRAEIDWTDAVSVHKELVQCAKSVGMIRSPNTCGTGFRVGPCYIMTAKHVVDQILIGTPVPLQQPMQFHPYHQLNNISVYIDFSYEREGLGFDENLRFHFEPEIVYSNADLDTTILKLKPDSREYPPPLIKFHDVAQSPQDRSHGYFIGHSRASIKKTDRYNFVIPTPDNITAAKKWSMDSVQVDGYDRIDDPHHVLFHCSFERGASGAPGLWICPGDGNAYVEVMLLRGYPSWYYDEKYKGKIDQVPKNYLVEQGVTMKSICNDMQIRNKPLCKEIFSE